MLFAYTAASVANRTKRRKVSPKGRRTRRGHGRVVRAAAPQRLGRRGTEISK